MRCQHIFFILGKKISYLLHFFDVFASISQYLGDKNEKNYTYFGSTADCDSVKGSNVI